jgi:hypothetical protein
LPTTDALFAQEVEPKVSNAVAPFAPARSFRDRSMTGVGRPRSGAHHGYDHTGRRGRHGKPPADDAA